MENNEVQFDINVAFNTFTIFKRYYTTLRNKDYIGKTILL